MGNFFENVIQYANSKQCKIDSPRDENGVEQAKLDVQSATKSFLSTIHTTVTWDPRDKIERCGKKTSDIIQELTDEGIISKPGWYIW